MDTWDFIDVGESAMDWESGDSSDSSESYDSQEMDAMLDALVDSGAEADSFAERVRGRRGGRPRPVPAASGRPAYRPPAGAGSGYVTQKQLQDALGRVGTDVRRNAQGIKTLNTRFGGVVEVNKVQSRAIGRIDKTLKVDGMFEFVEAYNGQSLSAYQLLKGAVKSGYLGQGSGALGNPLVLGGIALFLRNPQILSGLGLQQPAQPVP